MKKNILQVFLHYSWDSEENKDWILELANRLTADGVDLCFDQYDLQVGSNINHFMEKIENCEKVIYVMSKGYKAKANARSGGVGYEYQIMTSELASDLINTKKFIPVLRDGDKSTSIPMLLKPYLYLDMRDDELFEQRFVELLRLVFDEPKSKKPKLGKRPILDQKINEPQPTNSDDPLKISKKVHDVVANSVYSLMVEIEGEAELDREAMLDKLESLYERSRDISYDKPDFVEPAFQETVQKFLLSFSTSSTKVFISGNTRDVWNDLDKQKQYSIRSIMLEIMDNMKYHSGGDVVTWHFERSKDKIQVSYTDNGIGMDQYHSGRGRGLKNVLSLVNSIDGEFNLTTKKNKGVKIEISFQVKRTEENTSKKAKKSPNEYDFTKSEIEIVRLLSQGKNQQEISHILNSKDFHPSSLSSIEKRLNLIKAMHNLSTTAQIVALFKDIGLI